MDDSNAITAAESPLGPSKSVADVYLNLLRDEGYRPKLLPRASGELVDLVTFTARYTRFQLFCCEDDPGYFRLGCEYQLAATSCELPWLAHTANSVNAQVKGVKAVLAPEHETVRFTVEGFLTGKATPALLERSIAAILHAADVFFAERRPPKHLDA
jgi:hypothetical protein